MESLDDRQRRHQAPMREEEWVLWRSLGRLVHLLPRLVDEELMRAAGISGTEYAAMANLRAVPGHRLRMSELAAVTALSASRITRVVDSLRSRGFVRKERDAVDARAALAVLTDAGFDRLRLADPYHDAMAHRLVLDHVPAETVASLGDILTRVLAANAPDLPARDRRPADPEP